MRSPIADTPAEWTVKPNLPGPTLMRGEHETELSWKRRKAEAEASTAKAEPKPNAQHGFGEDDSIYAQGCYTKAGCL